jgi:hypothetical protein
MLIEQQIEERRQRAQGAIAEILERPGGQPYGDYGVKSASGKTYRLAMRGPGRRGTGKAGNRIRLAARRRAFAQSWRADGEVPARRGVPRFSFDRCGRHGAESPSDLGGG